MRRQRQRLELYYLEPKNAKNSSYQKLQRQERIDSSLEPLEGARPCQHLDICLLSSRTVSKYISVALSHLVSSNVLRQLQETDTVCIWYIENLFFYLVHPLKMLTINFPNEYLLYFKWILGRFGMPLEFISLAFKNTYYLVKIFS